MKFLLMIHSDEAAWEQLPAAEQERTMTGHADLTRRLTESGKLLGCHRLRPAAAQTVRYRPDGGRVVTDGPFAETKETMGGFYLIECDSLDEALGWAKDIPRAAHAGIEVREIWDTP